MQEGSVQHRVIEMEIPFNFKIIVITVVAMPQ